MAHSCEPADTAFVVVIRPGIEFAYSQAPPSMKSVVTALLFATIGIGDLLTGAFRGSLVCPWRLRWSHEFCCFCLQVSCTTRLEVNSP
jgi:dipeptide/tripeptide permease